MAKKNKTKGKGFNFSKNQNRLGVYEPLPKGKYRVAIKKVENGPTKAKDGSILAVTYEVLKGENKGKIFTKWYTYEHSNPTTVDIALQHIASLCDAIDVEFSELKDPSDFDEFVGKKLDIDVVVKAGDNNYGPSNDIQVYSEIGKDKEEKAGKDKKKKGKAPWEDEEEEKAGKDKKKKDKKKKKDS